MDDDAVGLNQLSRLMFDKAAHVFQWSLGVEFTAGLASIVLALIPASVEVKLAGAIAVFALLIVAFVLRQNSSATYDNAETMRRQSVLSESMGYDMGRAEWNEWRGWAGPKIMAEAAKNPRPDDYYDNQLGLGTKKLAEMTFESAHWTKRLYMCLRRYLLAVLAVAALALSVMLLATIFDLLPSHQEATLAQSVFLLASLVLTLDFLGMIIKLNRAVAKIGSLQVLLEDQAALSAPQVGRVMRLVAEYNCTVAAGLPIPNWVWRRHSQEIASSWSSAT